MNHHKDICQACGLLSQAVKCQNRMQEQQNQAVYHRGGSISNQQEFFRVIPHLGQVTRTHALSDYGNHGKVHALSHDTSHAVQAVGHAVGGNLRRSEARDDTHHNHTAQLENTVFDTAGNPYIQNFLSHIPFKPKTLPAQMNRIVRISQQ